MTQNAWNDFRENMPYGCEFDPDTRTLQFFNRDYSFVGASRQVWRNTPTSLLTEDGKVIQQEWFYGDGSRPIESAANMAAYREALSKFVEWTELGNGDGYPVRSAEYYLEQTKRFA